METTNTVTSAAAATDTTSTTFTDIIKNSVLDSFGTDIAIGQIIISLAISFIVGLFIYFLYRRIFSGILYSKSFNVALIGMTMITATVIIAINSNLVLSLGMVGALSIVRFRTPIKDPTDLIFLFWAAVAGIVTGAGFYTLAIIGSLVIGLILFFFIKGGSTETPYLLVVNCDHDTAEQQAQAKISAEVKKFNVKQKTVTPGNIEVTFEIRLKEKTGSFINNLAAIPGVQTAVLISYNGDYVS
ncbi:MAG: DUF4956 domain-containing protein [Candidatus Pristimantibacillus lignocellulolyticus]|uniref:DUF4956 domain-containing protein n=1 Tax=Candidatus Pristimantibacillus lignocellulolyticus TaxID=2994561 RepID=A0A9J6ZAE4_9BACL|nr:MAG: DUF4956 domain-containing protein [Candidatus Pristimantibacillus lignocellulolyticus]